MKKELIEKSTGSSYSIQVNGVSEFKNHTSIASLAEQKSAMKCEYVQSE